MPVADDPYFRNRDDDTGAWCVRGPDGFKLTMPGMTKEEAFIIGKVLSRRYGEATGMLQHLMGHG